MTDQTRKTLGDAVEKRLAAGQKELDEFQSRFTANPAHALEWAPLAAAACLHPLTIVLNACRGDLLEAETEESAYERIRAYIEQEALSHAERVHRSTSATSNLLRDYERECWVRMMKFANGHPLGWL